MEILHSIIDFFEVAFKNLPNFVPGIITTLELSVLSIIGGTIIGVVVNLMKMTKVKPIALIADLYVVIVRGTPLLLQLFFMFYCLPRLGINLNRFTSAVLGLSFHNGAYISEIFRGAILSIPNGQSEAAKAIGMTKLQSFRHVIFPQAFKNAVPALGNQFLLAIKDSSLASVITITETMMIARQLATATFAIFPIYFNAACIYMILTYTLSFLLKKLERRLKVNER